MRLFDRCQNHSYPLHSHHIHPVPLFTGSWSNIHNPAAKWKLNRIYTDWTELTDSNFFFQTGLYILFSLKMDLKVTKKPQRRLLSWSILCFVYSGIVGFWGLFKLMWLFTFLATFKMNLFGLEDFVFVLFLLGHSVCRVYILFDVHPCAIGLHHFT